MKVNKRIALDIFWIVLGSLLMILSKIGIIDVLFSGMGGGFIVVGIIQLIRAIRYKKDDEYKEKIDIEVNDERNKTIRMMAWSWTGYLMVIILSVITLIETVISNSFIAQICAFIICLILVIYWISYFVLQKKY